MTGKPFAVNDWKNPTRPYRGHIHRQRSSAKEKNVLHTIVDRNTALSINYSESNLVKYISPSITWTTKRERPSFANMRRQALPWQRTKMYTRTEKYD